MTKLIERLTNAFWLTEDLINVLSAEELNLRLGDLPSNTIGEQFWCMVGARESYLQAIIHGEWVGFSCSLTNLSSHEAVTHSLNNSAEHFIDNTQSIELNDTQTDFLLLLLEHEIQHHGQLIRYMYGNKLAFPDSWKDRYTV